MLDLLNEKYSYLYKGVVLDIGGRDRGRFKKPKDKVEKWIFADINAIHNPDIIIDVSDMQEIESSSIDVINAIELFEHVKKIDEGLGECYRVLKPGGILIISTPFLFPIHADPFDYQRWTNHKWRMELERIGFKIDNIHIMGLYYTHLAEMLKFKLKINEKNHSITGKLLNKMMFPFLNILSQLDNKPNVKSNPVLRNFHGGYFIVAKKR